MNYMGVDYKKPTVNLLHVTPLVNAELAGRTAYNSFDKAEDEQVMFFNGEAVDDIDNSELMNSLCHVYHHMSVAEHINVTFSIRNTSRGVLQEHSRHRIQSITVKSTRYTLGSLINTFVASLFCKDTNSDMLSDFLYLCRKREDELVTTDWSYNRIEYEAIYMKLMYQYQVLGRDMFLVSALSKDQLDKVTSLDADSTSLAVYLRVLNGVKQKKNVGDTFKHIITDNFSVDMIVTFNLRSLKNYFELRDSGAAYFQIQWLAQEMKRVLPEKYLSLIDKRKKNEQKRNV